MSKDRNQSYDRRKTEKAESQLEDKIYLPELSYFFVIIRRNFLKALFFAIFPILFVALSIIKFDYKYVSYETISYSSADSLFEDGAKTSYFLGYEAKFNNTLNDGEFLYNAVEAAGLYSEVIGNPEKYSKESSLRKLLKKIVPEDFYPPSWKVAAADVATLNIYKSLRSRLEISSDENTKSLTLAAQADDPALAQKLAGVLMDAFVVKMYEELLVEVEAGKAAHLNFIEEEKEKFNNKNDVYGLYEDEELSNVKELKLSKEEKVALKNQERKKIDELISAQNSLKTQIDNQLVTVVRLETELRALQTRLGEKHPNVIQKKEEIVTAKSKSNYKIQKRNIENMKKDLLRLQAKMKKAKIPVDRTVFNDKNTVNRSATDYSLKQRLDKYQIESDRLTKQLEYPSQRTRFKIIYGPSYSLNPANKKKLKMKVVVGVVLVLFIFFTTIIVNEVTSTTIRDTWIFTNYMKLPPDVELSAKDLKRQYLLGDRELAEIAVTASQSDSETSSLYKSIRGMERNILEGSKGRSALFYLLGDSQEADILIANVLNLIQADSLKDIIYLNFDYLSRSKYEGVWDFLSGNAKWSDVKLAKSKKITYFYVPPGNALGKLKFINSARRTKMYKALTNSDSYEIIAARALDVGYNIENTLIQSEVDDVYIFAFLGDLEKSKLELFNTYVDHSKIKGLFVIN